MSKQEKKTMKKGLLKSAKMRLLIFGGGVIALIAVVAIVVNHIYKAEAFDGAASVTRAPRIQSVPGTGNPSDEYVKLQNVQNAKQDKEARKKATSSIPTITRPSFVGDEQSFNQETPSIVKEPVHSPKECPIKKVVYMYKPNPANCSVPNLLRARQAGVTAEELLCQACSCASLREAGYTAGEMKNTGFTSKNLKTCGYTLAQLVAAGYNANDLKNAGFTADQLRNAGFTEGQLHDAGFDKASIDCSVSSLKKARENGVSAKTLKKCGAAALKAAGFTAAELKDAGFTAKQLKDAGFTAKQLKDAGFSAKALKDAGFTAKELKDAGFPAAALENAGFSDAALKAAGFSPASIKAAHVASQNCSVSELKKERDEGVSAAELKDRGCSLAALKAAGFTAKELKDAGFSAAQLKDAGFSAKELKDAGFSAKDLKDAGFSAKALKDAGFSAAQLKAAGFGLSALKNAGFSAKSLKDAGFSAKQLKNAGFSAKDLKGAGFDAEQLKDAGFNAGDLRDAGFSAKTLKDAGFSAKALRNAGFNAAELKDAGVSAKALKDAGFTSGDLMRAGFSPKKSGIVLHNESPLAEEKPKAPAVERPNNLPSITDNSEEGRLRALQKAENEIANRQQHEDMVNQMQLQMLGQAQKMMGGWSNPRAQTYQERTFKEPKQAGENGKAEGQGKTTGPVIKAGEVMFAVLDTSVNSDDTNTPVMATIVQGKLKGTKLIGSFNRVSTHLLVKFTTANVPGFEHTFGLNAVAIDPRTAHSVLSGYVNNHYLLRYGSLFASSFLSGVAQGVVQSESGPCLGIFGCFRSNQKLNPEEYTMLGLGNAGQQYANVMGSNFNTPPTVTIPGGVGIGILYMSDLTLPEPLPGKNHSVAPATVFHDDLD